MNKKILHRIIASVVFSVELAELHLHFIEVMIFI